MKDFIKHKLRILLEVVTYRDSSLNIPDIIKYGNSYTYTLDKFKDMIDSAQKLAKNIPDEQLSVDYGNGGYEYMLYQTREGDFIFRGKETTKYFEPGSYKESQGGKTLYLYTKACSGYSDDEVKCKIIYNPSVDAKIKILNDSVLVNVIEKFIDDNLGYLDGKGEEIRQAKMTPDQINKLKNKVYLYNLRNKQIKTIDSKEIELRKELNDLKLARLSTRDQIKIKQIRNMEAPLISQLKQMKEK